MVDPIRTHWEAKKNHTNYRVMRAECFYGQVAQRHLSLGARYYYWKRKRPTQTIRKKKRKTARPIIGPRELNASRAKRPRGPWALEARCYYWNREQPNQVARKLKRKIAIINIGPGSPCALGPGTTIRNENDQPKLYASRTKNSPTNYRASKAERF